MKDHPENSIRSTSGVPSHGPDYPQVLTGLAEAITSAIERKGASPDLARSFAEAAVEEIRTTFGGEPLYIPQGHRYYIERRNREIRRRLAAGETRAAVRRWSRLSVSQFSRIAPVDGA